LYTASNAYSTFIFSRLFALCTASAAHFAAMTLSRESFLVLNTTAAMRSAVRSSLALPGLVSQNVYLVSIGAVGHGLASPFFEENAPNESVQQSRSAMMAIDRRPLGCYPLFTASIFAIMARFAPANLPH